MDHHHCLNCNNELNEGQLYCSNCGQKVATHRLNTHEIGHDLVHYFTHADAGIFKLLKVLFKRPGTVAREYVRKKTAIF